MRVLGAIVLLVLVQAVAGCDGTASAPSAPSPVSQAVPPAASQPGPPSTPSLGSISGSVLDTGFRPLAGARVEVVDGPHAGMSASTDATGQFSLPGPFDGATGFRASLEGHVAATQTWTPVGAGQPWLLFYLEVVAPPVNIAGAYTLTFIADGACAGLPDDLRTRSYTATVAPASRPGTANTSFTVTAGGAPFLGGLDTFTIGVAGDYLGFWLHGGHDPALVEQVAPNTYLAFSGAGAASVAASGFSTISSAFEGWIDYCVTKTEMGPVYDCGSSTGAGQPVARVHCESTSHRLILTRR